MGLHRKFEALDSLHPDIAMIPECANLERLRSKTPAALPTEAVWTGVNPAKGLGVFA